MRLSRFSVVALWLVLHTATAAQPLTITPNPYDNTSADSLILRNDTAAPVTIDSLTLGSADASSIFFIGAFFDADTPDGTVGGFWACRSAAPLDGEPEACSPFRVVVASGGRVRMESFRSGCAICRPPETRSGAIHDTLFVYTDGSATPQAVALRLLFVASEAAPATGALALAVAPNPSSGRATLTIHATGQTRAVVVDALGREMAVAWDGPVAGEREIEMDTSRWPPGAYAVRASGAGRTVVARLMVVR